MTSFFFLSTRSVLERIQSRPGKFNIFSFFSYNFPRADFIYYRTIEIEHFFTENLSSIWHDYKVLKKMKVQALQSYEIDWNRRLPLSLGFFKYNFVTVRNRVKLFLRKMFLALVSFCWKKVPREVALEK